MKYNIVLQLVVVRLTWALKGENIHRAFVAIHADQQAYSHYYVFFSHFGIFEATQKW